MNTHYRFTAAAFAALLLPATITITACGNSASSAEVANAMISSSTLTTVNAEPQSNSSTLPDVSLPASVEPGSDAALAWEALMGPEGEYAAAASYQAVIDKFGQVEPYVAIKAGEERHAAALTRQLTRMGVSVPDNPYLGILEAPADLQAAAQAWADGEIVNVELYDKLLMQTDSANLTRVFSNLRRASLEEHLPAFEAAALGDGTLTEAQMSTYLHSGDAHGRGMGAGHWATAERRGHGRGGAGRP